MSIRFCDEKKRSYFVVEKRDKKTRQNTIKSEIAIGSIIYLDRWPTYNGLSQHGCTHNFVNNVNHNEILLIHCPKPTPKVLKVYRNYIV